MMTITNTSVCYLLTKLKTACYLSLHIIYEIIKKNLQLPKDRKTVQDELKAGPKNLWWKLTSKNILNWQTMSAAHNQIHFFF